MCVEKRCFEFDRGKDNVFNCNEFNIFVYVFNNLYRFLNVYLFLMYFWIYFFVNVDI